MPFRIAALLVLSLLAAAILCACGKPAAEPSSSAEEVLAPQPIQTIYPEWNASDIYQAGDIVIHDGKYFRALWWTRGHEPLVGVERDEWSYLGDVPLNDTQYFSDVHDSAWYADAINTLAKEGILDGIGSSRNFLPSRPVTRAQFVVMLCRALDIAPAESGDNFLDAGDTWYTPYLAAFKQHNLSGGAGDDYFLPQRAITREELCKLIYAACDGFAEDPATALAGYSDADALATWAIQPVSWCIERGIVQGSGHKLLPEQTASRAEAAQILCNLLSRAA